MANVELPAVINSESNHKSRLSAATDSSADQGLWNWIKTQVNLALYRPQPTEGVVVSRLQGREGVYYVLRSADESRYLKLTEADYYLWTQMDGQRTVKDLVVAYFLRYGAFAFGRVSQLVRELRKQGFFTDRSIDVIGHVQTELDAREVSGLGARLMGAFVHKEISFDGIDLVLGRLYRYFSWLFWSPVQFLLLLIILIGFIAFVDTLVDGEIPLLTAGGSYWLGLLALLAINAVVILVHEMAHGLATKYFGRRVRRGGFLIYYGYPTFFVDTMDMWMEERRARIAVSWAGPHSGLVLGGVCALLVRFLPESAAVPWFYKVAFVAYLSVYVNLNPLLELDGYFILIDLLDVPMLRQRAFGFVRQQLWHELRQVWRSWRAGRADFLASFTRQERFLALFGLLAVAYSGYSLWLALYFWQTQVLIGLRELWSRHDWISRLLIFLLVVVVIVPLVIVISVQMIAWIRRAAIWVKERELLERQRNVYISMALLFVAVILGPVLIYDPWWSHYLAIMPALLYFLAGITFGQMVRLYRGSKLQRVFVGLVAAVGLLWLSSVARALANYTGDFELLIPWVYILERLATLPLVLAGFLSLSGVHLQYSPRRENMLMGLVAIMATLAVVPVVRWTADASLLQAVLRITAPYLAFIFLATAMPSLTAFAGTRFFVPWSMLAMAAFLTGCLTLLRTTPSTPAATSDWDRWLSLLLAGLWAWSGFFYLIASKGIRFIQLSWRETKIASDEGVLRQAFVRFTDHLLWMFREVFGRRRAQALEGELNRVAEMTEQRIKIDNGYIVDGLLLDQLTISEQGDSYREVLDRMVDLIDDWAGARLTERAVQTSYDSLSWAEREVLASYVLAGTRWGEAISAEFVVDQSKRWHLVRALPLFIHCNEQALSLVVNALKGERVPAGTVLAREGARMERFILIESGKIEVWRRSKETQDLELVGELHRGASLGDETFFGNGYYGATYRTVVATDILFLDVEACQRLVRSGVALATRVGALLQMVRLLAGMPLFNHLSPQQLSEVSRRLRRRTVTDQEVIAREGELRHSLFLVWSGEVEAFSRDSQGERSLAHVYTPGEHFGEYALFVDTPYRFTYRARGPGTLLLLDEATFDSLVAQSDRMAGYVEQIGSGRLLRMTRQADKS